jgi:RNA polymerase-interacting CarD/CdnL/TRCF family regulator
MEERTVNGNTSMYYVIEAADLTIWVPADENLASRLRAPSSAAGFRAVISILSEPAQVLPSDYRQRSHQLQSMLRDGGVEARCRVIRDLSAYRHKRGWSDHDRTLMKSAEKVLLGEWSFSLSITPEQAEADLRRSLASRRE